jgi:hypothetical protein
VKSKHHPNQSVQPNLSQPLPVLFLEKKDFEERGCAYPTPLEIEEVRARLQAYFINDGTFDQVLSDAINHVKAKRDLF